jgi:Dodecin
MPDNVYSVSEIVGSSKQSVDDAIRGAVQRGSKTGPAATGGFLPERALPWHFMWF